MSTRRADPPAASGGARRARDVVAGVLPVVAIVTVTRVALAEPYRIPSGSTEPTLQVGDWLWVNKLRYGPHIPFTRASLPGYAEPRRGDVAVFASPPLVTGAADGFAREPLPVFRRQHRAETSATSLGPAVARSTLHEWGPLVVPAGSYFMMGDNRDDSVDSRFYGPVPRENMRGRPTFVYYSYEPDVGTPYLRAVTAIRWRRLGEWIR